MQLEGPLGKLFDKGLRAHIEHERAWWNNDRRGRWVVLEPGPGRLLTEAPRHVRDYVDAITPQRGRRFRSLSRARAFAREIGGEVRRWRRKMPRRVAGRTIQAAWRYETNSWKVALDRTRLCLLPVTP